MKMKFDQGQPRAVFPNRLLDTVVSMPAEAGRSRTLTKEQLFKLAPEMKLWKAIDVAIRRVSVSGLDIAAMSRRAAEELVRVYSNDVLAMEAPLGTFQWVRPTVPLFVPLRIESETTISFWAHVLFNYAEDKEPQA